jgi:hypothetical protein
MEDNDDRLVNNWLKDGNGKNIIDNWMAGNAQDSINEFLDDNNMSLLASYSDGLTSSDKSLKLTSKWETEIKEDGTEVKVLTSLNVSHNTSEYKSYATFTGVSDGVFSIP